MDSSTHQASHSVTEEEAYKLSKSFADKAQQYALALCKRVKSFEIDPLHSAADLSYLARYLKAPFQNPSKRQHPLENLSPLRHCNFITQYLLLKGKSPTIRSFDNAYNFSSSAAAPSQNEILFLTGRPSADWLNCLGSAYSLDHRFLHQHLGPLISGPMQYWNTALDLPSRSIQVLTLRIPTIIFAGPRGRNLDIRCLEIAREKYSAQLRRACLSIQNSAASEVGRSVVRRVEVLDGSTLMIEQQVTIKVIQRGRFWTIIIWSDAGNETDYSHVPVPQISDFTSIASDLRFCPIFFDNEFTYSSQHKESLSKDRRSISQQPLALLSTRYGMTIDWGNEAITMSPLVILQELFSFSAASTLQYINMLDCILSKVAERNDFPSYEHTKLETTVQYDYIKASLSRVKQNCSDTLAFLKAPPTDWASAQTLCTTDSATVGDFEFLITRAISLLRVCEDGKATLISNDSIQASNRSVQEAKLVTQLTKATNRLTFIFLPLSFLTSVFGMNFRQLGQGPLTIWIWVGIAIPMFIICVAAVERGEWIRSKWR